VLKSDVRELRGKEWKAKVERAKSRFSEQGACRSAGEEPEVGNRREVQ
jgi:hypothetical protein